MVRPKPVPPNFRLILISPWVKLSNIESILSLGIPIPVSITENSTSTKLALESFKRIVTVILPESVNFMALLIKFVNSCVIRSESPRIHFFIFIQYII